MKEYGYWQESRHEHGLVNSAFSLAKFVTIAAIGVGAGRSVLRNYGADIATYIGRKIGKTGEPTADAMIGSFFSREFQMLSTDTRQIRESVFTSRIRASRVDKFISVLEDQVTPETRGVLQNPESRKKMVSMLDPVAKAAELSELENNFLSKRTRESFLRESEKMGVIFKDSFLKDNETHLKRIASETIRSIDRTTIDSTLYESMVLTNEANRKMVLQAMESAQKSEASRSNYMSQTMGYRNLTLNDIKGDANTREAVDKYLDAVSSGGRKKITIGDVESAAKKHLQYALGDTTPEYETALELLGTANTGLVIDKRGRVVSGAALREARENFVDKALQELQIPLVPFLFNVPADSLRLLKPWTKNAFHLGNINLASELKREGFTGGAHTQGVSYGGRLLTIDPEANNITFHDTRIAAYHKRRNIHLGPLSDIRNTDEDVSIRSRLEIRPDKTKMSQLQKSFYNDQGRWINFGYDKEKGFVATGKNAVGNLLVNRFFGTGHNIDPIEIHPKKLLELMNSSHLENMNPNDIARAYSVLVSEGKSIGKSYGENLRRLHQKIQTARPGEFYFPGTTLGNEDYTSFMHMLKNADNPDELIFALHSQFHTDTGLDFGKISRERTNQFYKSMTNIQQDPEGLLYISAGEGGYGHYIKNSVLGLSSGSKSLDQLQKGLFAEVLQGFGIGKLNRLTGGEDRAAIQELMALQKGFEGNFNMQEEIRVNPLSEIFERLGLVDGNNNYDERAIRNIVDSIVKIDPQGKTSINIRDLGKLGISSMTPDELMSFADEPASKAVIANIYMETLQSMDIFGGKNALSNLRYSALMQQVIEHGQIAEAITKRYRPGRPWHPEPLRANPFDESNFFVVQDSAPNLYEFLGADNHTKQSIISDLISRVGGIGDFSKSLVDPNQPLGKFGLGMTTLLQMPNRIAGEVGTALPASDRMTALRSTLGFYGKRVLPLIAAYEAYKNINANLHEAGLPGIDDFGANTIANFNLGMAKLKDSLGLTDWAQQTVGGLSGLDEWFSPRSEEEYRDYLTYGDEEVRYGRGWMVGSRTPILGTHVKYSRPNFYRRWTSHWTEAENVDIANPEYSWLPSPLHPFSTFKRLFNPNWWVEKHKYDRPYIASDRSGMGSQEGLSYTAPGYELAAKFGGGYATSLVIGPGGAYPDLAGNGPYSSGGEIGSQTYIGGTPVGVVHNKATPINDNRGILSGITDYIEAARTQMGLFGAVFKMMPFYPEQYSAGRPQDPDSATSFSRMAWSGEYGEILGPFSEFFRRFIQPETQDYNAPSPYRNNMPSWIPSRFHTGDPYTRLPGIGEFILPGEAAEKLHPWWTPLRVRGSSIGGSIEEIIEDWLNPLGDPMSQESEDIVQFGSAFHKKWEQWLRKKGVLVGSEISIYNEQYNISGTIDAIVNTPRGLEIIDPKTQDQKMFNEGVVPEKYIDQVTTYMATTGITTAHILFVNRQDVNQTRDVVVHFDEKRWQKIIERVQTAREIVNGMVERGEISPFETYGLLARVEILSHIAPESREYRNLLKEVKSGRLTTQEKHVLGYAEKRAKKLTEQYNLYPVLTGPREKRRVRVKDIYEDGTILTDAGMVKLAGVNLDAQAFALESPVEVFEKLGVRIGSTISITVLEGQFNKDIMNDFAIPVLIDDGRVNKKFINSRYGGKQTDARDPLSKQVVYGHPNRIWEWFSRSDGMIQNKFLRVRSGLTQFERGEVYGTDDFKWNDIYGTLIEPSINSFISKDHFTAAIQSSLAASLFFRTKSVKLKAAGIIGAIHGAAAIVRELYESTTGDTWTPNRYRRQGEFDEYWDILKYIKWTAISEAAKKEAKSKEHIDIDELQESEKRKTVVAGPWTAVAIDAERKALSTMFGTEEAAASLQDAISALPRRQRQIAKEIVLWGSPKEKEEFYELLPSPQKRILAKFLGQDRSIPEKPNLREYFKNHFLPDMNWEGWDMDVDLDDLKVRASELEGMKVETYSKARIAKAQQTTKNVSVPQMNSSTGHFIRRRLMQLIESGKFGDLHVDIKMRPSEESVVNMDYNIFEDKTREIIEEIRSEANY